MNSMNPFSRFIHSAKFWAFILTSGSALIIYFATKYLSPSSVEDIKMLLGFFVGLAGVYIASVAYEDGKKAENTPTPSVVIPS